MTRRASVLVSAALGLCILAGLTPAGAHEVNTGRKCGSIAFAPNTDFSANNIRASGTTCKVGRAVARRAKTAGKRYVALGYDCRGKGHEPRYGLAHTDFRCTKGHRLVTFNVT